MSRHKLVKNIDLDDELDDFDGGEDYDVDDGGVEGLSSNQWQACTYADWHFSR